MRLVGYLPSHIQRVLVELLLNIIPVIMAVNREYGLF